LANHKHVCCSHTTHYFRDNNIMLHMAKMLRYYLLFNCSLTFTETLVMLITVEFSRFHIVYLLILKCFTIGPAGNYHTLWVYIAIFYKKTFHDRLRLLQRNYYIYHVRRKCHPNVFG